VSYQSNNCDLSVTSGGFVPAVLLKCLVAREGEGMNLNTRPFVETCVAARSRQEREVLVSLFDER